MEGLIPYDFHLMLHRLGKELLPQAHYVTDLNDCVDRLAKYSDVIVPEFEPRFYYARVMLNFQDFYHLNPDARAEFVGIQYRFAFYSLREKITHDWDFEVMPRDVPAGE